MAKMDTVSAVVMVIKCALVPQWPDILLLALARAFLGLSSSESKNVFPHLTQAANCLLHAFNKRFP